jgi:selenocysteine-specific elongation factor
VAAEKAVAPGDWIADGAWWKSLREEAMAAIDQEHRLRPQHLGLPLVEVKHVLEKLLPAPELFDALIGDLCRHGFVQEGVTIRRTGHSAALPPQLQAAGSRLRSTLNAKPFDPPSRKELAPDATAQQALRFLLQTGEAAEVGDEVVLLTEHYAQAVDRVKTHLREKGPATVSELRQTLGASRRIVVPLLERLDREGITRREGDKRVLRQKG